MAQQAALKEAVDAKKKKRAEEAQRWHEKEKEIARRVRAGENRSDVEAELELEEPMEMGGYASSSEDEGGRDVIVTSVERREPTAKSDSGGCDAERRGNVPVLRKRIMSSDVVDEREAKRTWSLHPSEASSTLFPPAFCMAG